MLEWSLKHSVSFLKKKNKFETSNKITNGKIMGTRVLRSHKRKLKEIEKDENVKVEQKRKKRSLECDVSIIALSDSNTDKDETVLITSTPINQKRSKTNCKGTDIKASENTTGADFDDVIVISDSSASQVIVLSDEEKSVCDIEIVPAVIPPAVRKDVLSDVNKNALENDNCSERFQRNKYLNKRRFGRKRRPDRKQMGFRSYNCGGASGAQNKVGENVYIENPIVFPKTGLRPIIIDGSNVAFHHSNNSYFSCRGLEICIKYFKQRGHQVTAFVPHFRVQNRESDNPKLLDQLVKNGDVVLTPSRKVDGSLIVSYDDRYIVQTAALKGGIIVTRDNYRDLLAENPSWAETIKYRLLQFTWVQDILLFPNDPLGKRGPTLEDFLKFG